MPVMRVTLRGSEHPSGKPIRCETISGPVFPDASMARKDDHPISIGSLVRGFDPVAWQSSAITGIIVSMTVIELSFPFAVHVV
jgi:hypothetical protein